MWDGEERRKSNIERLVALEVLFNEFLKNHAEAVKRQETILKKLDVINNKVSQHTDYIDSASAITKAIYAILALGLTALAAVTALKEAKP
jgi:D-alanyl-D-alanine dipeptidase